MPAVLVVGVAEKASGDKIRLPMDFGNEPLLIQGYRIVSFGASTSGSGAPTVTGAQLDYPYQLSCLVDGGTSGSSFDIVYSVTFNDPDSSVRARTGVLKVL